MVSGYVAVPSTPEAYELREPFGPLLLDRPRSYRNTSALVTISPDGKGYSYAYGPKGVRGLLQNRYALGCAAFASIGGLTFGYDQGVIANVLVMKDFTTRWPIGSWEKGLMTAVLELGALFGALSAGILADRSSRRHCMLLACVIFCIGSVFQCGARSLRDLIIGRAIGGIGVGALSMLSPLYVAEISPPELRGSLLALEQLAIVFGVILGFWAGFLTRTLEGSMSWRIPLGIQIIPGVLLCIGSLSLPPSPRLLVLNGQYDDALKSLARLRLRPDGVTATDPLLQLELLEMRVEASLLQRDIPPDSKNICCQDAVAWARLFDRKYIDRTLIGVLVMFFQQWSGINALLYYGPTLVQSIGIKGDVVLLMVAGGISVVQFIAVFPVIMYIDQLGRKPLLRGGSLVMMTSHLMIAFLIYQFSDDWNSHYSAAWLAVICIYVFTFAYGFSFGPIGWVLPSEVFPISMRSKGVAVSTASNWINNFAIGLLTPPLIEMSPMVVFLIFSFMCFLAYFFSVHLVPETANVSLEEIDTMFRSAIGQEERAVRKQVEQDLGLEELLRELSVDNM